MTSHKMVKTIAQISSTSGDAEEIKISINGKEIFFRTAKFINPSCDFAIWATLPIAMRQGGILQIQGTTSKAARDNAERISIIWSTWLPKKFKPIRVTSDGFLDAEPSMGAKSLMLYSGGVDSTFALKRYVEEGHEKPDVLTIHGMDYQQSDKAKFERLKKRTADFRAKYSDESIEVISNAASTMRRFGVASDIGHGFQLFATLFLFDATHNIGLIAADYTVPQDYLTIPWGTNSLTNALFYGTRMHIKTLSNDVTRGEKLRQLHSDDLALKTLSFCKNYSVRPDNCGTCTKCVRTKAMFHAAGLTVPDIFRIKGYHAEDLKFIDLSKPSEIAFCLDILAMAREAGTLSDFQMIADHIFENRRPSKFQRIMKKGEAYFRGAKTNG